MSDEFATMLSLINLPSNAQLSGSNAKVVWTAFVWVGLVVRKKKYKVETEIENWIQKYDMEMGEKQVCVGGSP